MKDQEQFNNSLDAARRSAGTPEEFKLVDDIERGYQNYQAEMTQLRDEVKRVQKPVDFRVLDKGHPIRHVLDSCHELVEVTSARMDDTFRESDTVGRQARLAMLLLGLGGPLGGILCGYGIARGLSRTIYQLSVRVQDINQRLDQDVAAVNVAADGDLFEHIRHHDALLGRHLVREHQQA